MQRLAVTCLRYDRPRVSRLSWRRLASTHIASFTVSKDAPQSQVSAYLDRKALDRYGSRPAGLHISDSVQQRQSQFVDAAWLRDMCQCERCVNPKTGQKNFSTSSIPDMLYIHALHSDGASMHVTWGEDNMADHTSAFSIKDVLSYLKPSVAVGDPKPWISTQMGPLYCAGDNCTSYDSWLGDERMFTKMLRALSDYGLVFIDNVPRDEEAVVRIAERIGPLRHTFYGRTWDVKDKPDSQNVAYTATDLELHMDLLYMKQPPGVQLLHCLDDSSEGGLSTFSDSFMAAQIMYQSLRGQEAFRALASYPVSYHYMHPGRAFYDTKVTFEVDELAQQTLQRQSTKTVPAPLKYVNWSPPFQAPFTADLDLPESGRFRDYLTASKLFSSLINDPSLLYQRRLEPGQCVIFNNRRVLHGRTAFTSSSTKQRFLKGCYLDTDDFESHLRQRHLITHNRPVNGQKTTIGN